MKVTNLFFLFLACVSMLATSCSNDDEDAATDCVPTIINIGGNAASKSTLGYGSDRMITSVNIEGTDALKGTVAYSSGKPAKFTVSDSDFGPGYIEYTYNNGGQLTQMNVFSTFLPGSPAGRFVFEYNNSGQVTKVSEYLSGIITGGGPGMELNSVTVLSYDGKGNVSKETFFDGNDTSPSNTIDYTYDTYVNPGSSLEKLRYGYSSPNNKLTAISKDASGTVLKGESYSRIYKYNTNNYPTEYTETNQSGTVSTSNVTYDCI